MSQKAAAQVRYWSKTAPPGAYDVIVVGSGIGGMTAAAMLAKQGRRVLVLEQHYVPGGFTHEFKRKGYTWDVGVHAVGEVTEHSLTGRILASLTDGRLKWNSLGPVYDHFTFPPRGPGEDNYQIGFPDSPHAFREALLEGFPTEGASIDAYLMRVKEVAGAMRGYYLSRASGGLLGSVLERTIGRAAQGYLTQSTKSVLDELVPNPHLRAVLASQWGYYGSIPERSSFAMQALVTRHFLHGAYYPEGGSGRIAVELLRPVAEAGGWTRIHADVEQILIESGKAVGVRLATGEEHRAPIVISAAGVQSTVTRLLPPEVKGQAWAQGTAQLPPASAHVCLYIGFKGDIRAAGAGAANRWFYNTWPYDVGRDWWSVEAPLQDAECLYCSFPSLKDPHYEPGPEQRHTGEVVTFVSWDAFAKWSGTKWRKRGEGYEALKQELTDHLLAQFLRRMPELADMVDYAELSTPLSTEYFCRPMQGSIYGIEPTPDRFRNQWLRPRSPVPGLFFGGSEVSSVGVIGAMMGGVMAALAASPIDSLRFVQGLSAPR